MYAETQNKINVPILKNQQQKSLWNQHSILCNIMLRWTYWYTGSQQTAAPCNKRKENFNPKESNPFIKNLTYLITLPLNVILCKLWWYFSSMQALNRSQSSFKTSQNCYAAKLETYSNRTTEFMNTYTDSSKTMVVFIHTILLYTRVLRSSNP